MYHLVMTKNIELTKSEQLENNQLKAIFVQKQKELDLSQEKAAEKLKMSQGAVGHYLNGRRRLNIKIALKFSELLRIPVSSFSPRLQNEIDQGDKDTAEYVKFYELAPKNVQDSVREILKSYSAKQKE